MSGRRVSSVRCIATFSLLTAVACSGEPSPQRVPPRAPRRDLPPQVLVHGARALEQLPRQEQEPDVPLPGLRDELLALWADEDASRLEALRMRGGEYVYEPDPRRAARFVDIIDRFGWPDRSIVGEEAAHAAALLAQSLRLGYAFTRECSILLEQAVARGEAAGEDLAHLTDVIRFREGRPQLYGTMFGVPIEDPAGLDERRRGVGLPALGVPSSTGPLDGD